MVGDSGEVRAAGEGEGKVLGLDSALDGSVALNLVWVGAEEVFEEIGKGVLVGVGEVIADVVCEFPSGVAGGGVDEARTPAGDFLCDPAC